MTCMQKQRRSNWDQVRQTGEYIKVYKNQLLESVRGPQPDLALQSFYGDMSSLCSRPGAFIDPSHLNAVIGATAKAWTPAWARLGQQKQQQARHEMHAFLTEMLQRLQPLLPDVGARQAANLLWSSAKLGLNPDALLPGMTDSLAHQFMADMDVATGQEFANVLVACVKLQLEPCQGGLVKAICGRLATVDISTVGSQAVANTLHSLAMIPAAAPSVEVLDALCQRFGVLLKSRQPAELPNEQSIVNTLRALSKLKHAPSDELAMSMMGRMVALCRVPGQQPTPQAISNVLLACAELSVPVKQADSGILADLVLNLDRRQVGKQEYANTAWSLAIMGHLCQDQFALLLVLLTALSAADGEMLNVLPLKIPELRQLYQSLDWLQPPSSAPAQQQKAWSSLQGKLHRLGPKPAPDKPSMSGNSKLCAALNQLQLPFKAVVSIQSYYWVDAVLESQDNQAEAIMLRLFTADHIKTIPGR